MYGWGAFFLPWMKAWNNLIEQAIPCKQALRCFKVCIPQTTMFLNTTPIFWGKVDTQEIHNNHHLGERTKMSFSSQQWEIPYFVLRVCPIKVSLMSRRFKQPYDLNFEKSSHVPWVLENYRIFFCSQVSALLLMRFSFQIWVSTNKAHQQKWWFLGAVTLLPSRWLTCLVRKA